MLDNPFSLSKQIKYIEGGDSIIVAKDNKAYFLPALREAKFLKLHTDSIRVVRHDHSFVADPHFEETYMYRGRIHGLPDSYAQTTNRDRALLVYLYLSLSLMYIKSFYNFKQQKKIIAYIDNSGVTISGGSGDKFSMWLNRADVSLSVIAHELGHGLTADIASDFDGVIWDFEARGLLEGVADAIAYFIGYHFHNKQPLGIINGHGRAYRFYFSEVIYKGIGYYGSPHNAGKLIGHFLWTCEQKKIPLAKIEGAVIDAIIDLNSDSLTFADFARLIYKHTSSAYKGKVAAAWIDLGIEL